jgi:hypothetical protein
MHTLPDYERFLGTIAPDEMSLSMLRDSKVEAAHLPPFIFTWKPEQKPSDFLGEYFSAIEPIMDSVPEAKQGAFYEAVEARAMRGWVALAREHDLFLMLKGELPIVTRSLDLDYRGIDVLIVYKNKPYAVIAYTETARGVSYHKQKMASHASVYGHLTPVSMPLTMDAAGAYKPRDINSLKLYPWAQVRDLINDIKTGEVRGEPSS